MLVLTFNLGNIHDRINIVVGGKVIARVELVDIRGGQKARIGFTADPSVRFLKDAALAEAARQLPGAGEEATAS